MSKPQAETPQTDADLIETAKRAADEAAAAGEKTKEIGGPKGPEPTRYGDWEHKGRCIDF